MQVDRKKIIVIIVTCCIYALQGFTPLSKYNFTQSIQSVQFKESGIHVLDSFPTSVSTPVTVVLFIKTDKVPDIKNYSAQILDFLQSFTFKEEKKPTLFFIMSISPDTKTSAKKNQGEMISNFIAWLPSYYKKCTIVVIADRNACTAINHATHLPYLKTHPIDTIIHLYPTIPAKNNILTDTTLYVPYTKSYKNLYVIYSDHVNLSHFRKSLKYYSDSTDHYSYLFLKDNQQVTSEDFLSPFYAQRMSCLFKAPALYPHHKNFIVSYDKFDSYEYPTILLKNVDLNRTYKKIAGDKLRTQAPSITYERYVNEKHTKALEQRFHAPLKTNLKLSEQSEHFYSNLSNH